MSADRTIVVTDEIGGTHRVTAAAAYVADGALTLTRADGEGVAVFARGHWSAAIEQQDTTTSGGAA